MGRGWGWEGDGPVLRTAPQRPPLPGSLGERSGGRCGCGRSRGGSGLDAPGAPRGRGFAPGPGGCHRPLLGAAPGPPAPPPPLREQLRAPSVAAGLCPAPAVLSAAPVPSRHGPAPPQPRPIPQPHARKLQPCFTLAAQRSMIAASAPSLKLTVSNLQPCTQYLRPTPRACGPVARVCSPCSLFFAHIFPLHGSVPPTGPPQGCCTPAALQGPSASPPLRALLAMDAGGGSAQCSGEIHRLRTSPQVEVTEQPGSALGA